MVCGRWCVVCVFFFFVPCLVWWGGRLRSAPLPFRSSTHPFTRRHTHTTNIHSGPHTQAAEAASEAGAVAAGVRACSRAHSPFLLFVLACVNIFFFKK